MNGVVTASLALLPDLDELPDLISSDFVLTQRIILN